VNELVQTNLEPEKIQDQIGNQFFPTLLQKLSNGSTKFDKKLGFSKKAMVGMKRFFLFSQIP
jgi:hypothetical protein